MKRLGVLGNWSHLIPFRFPIPVVIRLSSRYWKSHGCATGKLSNDYEWR